MTTNHTATYAHLTAWERHHVETFGVAKVLECAEEFGGLRSALEHLDKFEPFNHVGFLRADRTADAPKSFVIRKYRCGDCGYTHREGVEVTLDEPTVRGRVVGRWCCNECGSEFWDNVVVRGGE